MRTVWITGAGGLIGNYLVQSSPAGVATIGLTRAVVDLADYLAVRKLFHEQNPQLIIHCAALSQSPACQADPPLAHKLNVDVTANLAALASAIPFIFFSTDLVFDGQKGDYRETDVVNPLSIYAETKVAAERVVLANPRHCVVRTSLNGGTSPAGHRGFNEELRLAWQQGRTVKLFTDEYRSPMAAVETAKAVWELSAHNPTGIYHIAGTERLSRWQIGQLIAARCPHLNPKMKASSLKEYQGAPRPPNCSLNSNKLQKALNRPLPGLTNWLNANPTVSF